MKFYYIQYKTKTAYRDLTSWCHKHLGESWHPDAVWAYFQSEFSNNYLWGFNDDARVRFLLTWSNDSRIKISPFP